MATADHAERLLVAANASHSSKCMASVEALYGRIPAFARDRHRCTLTNIIDRRYLRMDPPARQLDNLGVLVLTTIPKVASSTLLRAAIPSIAPSWRRQREFGKPNATLGVRASVSDPRLSDCRLLRSVLARAVKSAGTLPNRSSKDGRDPTSQAISHVVHNRTLHAVVVREPFTRALSAVREVLETQCMRWHAFNVALGKRRVHARWELNLGGLGGNVSVELAPGTVGRPGSSKQPSEHCVLQPSTSVTTHSRIGTTSTGMSRTTTSVIRGSASANQAHEPPRWWVWNVTPASTRLAYRAILHDLRLGFDNLHLVPQSVYLRQSIIPADAVLRAESLDDDWHILLESAGIRAHAAAASPSAGASTRVSSKSSAEAPLSQLRHRLSAGNDPSLADLGAPTAADFCAVFASDYDCLGYAMPDACATLLA